MDVARISSIVMHRRNKGRDRRRDVSRFARHVGHALAIVGCTEAEIVTLGHSLRGVRSILDANYLHRDAALGESAIRKLEQRK